MNETNTLAAALVALTVWSAPLLSAEEATSTPAQPQGQACDSPRRMINMHYIQALPGQKENLKKYIGANILAIDAIAVERGLMKAYTVMERVDSSESDDWDIMLVDTWCDERGVDPVLPGFQEISKQHTPVLIDGKSMEELGKFVRTRTVIQEDVKEP